MNIHTLTEPTPNESNKRSLRFVVATRLSNLIEALRSEEGRPGESMMQKVDRLWDKAESSLSSLADAIMELRDLDNEVPS